MAASAGLGIAGWVGLVQAGLKRLRGAQQSEAADELKA